MPIIGAKVFFYVLLFRDASLQRRPEGRKGYRRFRRKRGTQIGQRKCSSLSQAIVSFRRGGAATALAGALAVGGGEPAVFTTNWVIGEIKANAGRAAAQH